MRYDFENLKTVQCFNAIELRIPAYWHDTEIDDDSHSFWNEQDEDSGTFFIKRGTSFQRPSDGEDFDERRFVEEYVEFALKRADPLYADSMILIVPDGYVWRARYDDHDASTGKPLRNFQYIFFLHRGDVFTAISARLVLPLAVLGDEEVLDLLGVMDREIFNARIDPFDGLTKHSPVRDSFGSLIRVDFEGMIVLSLPETMICAPVEAGKQWYGFFKNRDIEARLMVMASEFELAEGADWHVGVESVISGMRCDFPDKQIDFRNIAMGFISHCAYDDSEISEPDSPDEAAWRNGPLHLRWWRVMRFHGNEARSIDIQLTLPLPRAETPLLKALTQLLDEQIQKAILPGIDGPTRT